MLKIELKKVEELYDVVFELCSLTYLQRLCQWSEDEKVFGDDYTYIQGYTHNYLGDAQEKVVASLWRLISSDDFTER